MPVDHVVRRCRPTPEVDEEEPATVEGADEDAASPQPDLPDLVDPVAETLAALRRKGFGRLLVDGQTVSLEDVDPATLQDRPTLQVIVDRVKIDGDLRDAAHRLDRDGLRRRRRRGVRDRARQRRCRRRAPIVHRFSERFECRECGIPYEVPQPRLFSFNNPFGACPICHGFGNIIELDMDLVVPDPSKSIAAERDRAVEQAALPRAARRAEARGEAARRPPRRAVGRSDRRREAVRHRRRRRELRRRPGLLPLARAQEIQGARPRVPQPLSRLPDLPGVRRRAAAARSARRPGRRPDHRRGLRR